MFKVECPGCKAPYQVDERRIPPSGLKMRCPKCGTSFKVDPPTDAQRTGPSPVLGAVFGMGADSMPPPPAPAPAPAPAPPRSSALKTTMTGVAPQAALVERAKGSFGFEPARVSRPDTGEVDFDLPSPAPNAGLPMAAPPRGGAAAAPRVAGVPPAARADAGLPRPPAPPSARAAVAPAPAAPARAAPPPARREQPSDAEANLDLPAPVAPKPSIDLPSPAAPRVAPGPRAAAPAASPRVAPTIPASRGAATAAPPAAAAGPGPSGLEVDLPSIAEANRPAPPRRQATRSFGDIELDLPAAAPSAKKRLPGAGSALDLPGPADRGDLPGLADPGDLPDLQRTAADFGLDLPDLAQPGVDLPDLAPSSPPVPIALDLPDLGAGLPSPAAASLPSVSKAALPAVSRTSLPSVAEVSLPSLSKASLPSPASAGFPVAAAPAGSVRQSSPGEIMGSIDLGGPEPGLDAFGELDLPLITPPEQPGRPSRSAFGSATALDPLEADPFGEASLPPVHSSPSPARGSVSPSAGGFDLDGAGRAPVVRQQGGGTSYGEVDLAPGADAEMPLEAVPQARPPMRSEDDMEFGGVPQESAPTAVKRPAPVEAQAARVGGDSKPPRRSKRALQVGALVAVIVIGGAALALVPAIGPFGAYWALDRVRAGEYQKLLADTVATAQRRARSDSFAEAKAALAGVNSARDGARRVLPLAAYSSFLGFTRELRFGADAEVHARSRVQLDGLEAEKDVEFLELARAARAASEGQLARARQLVNGALSRAPRDIDVLVLKGEVELRARDSKAALAAFTELAKLEDGARAAFGLARARFAAGELAGAERDAELALTKNPHHIGARILIARIASSSREREPRAVAWLEEIAKNPAAASPEELVVTHTLLGDIHISRSRISRAESAYNEALKIDPKAARALVGLGEALYRAGRYSEAQARFEAGSQADPDDVLAKVGVAKSKLMLERLEDAHASLKKLYDAHRGSMTVAYWFGRLLEAIGNRDEAERVYREAIAKAAPDPALVDAYIALALLQDQQGRGEDAKKTLQDARERLPRSAAIHRAVGEVALSHGRYAEAQKELRQALELDPEELGARFRLGSALRRDGKFDEALRVFEQVKAVDADYPGLALEHGLLFEASGRMEEALKAYVAALPKAPDDPDLMLRVGCGYAAAGRSKEAQPLLKKVLSLRPTSAETNYCLGRALLAEGSRLADALRQFDRAVELDPHKAEYHLYVGWAANEAGNVPKAEKALDEAIKLDQGLADAYWQRGVLRARQGAVREAIADLTRALALRPSRHEAHAALADAYYDSGKENLALAEWKKAVTAQPENATWRFRYGKLLAANQLNDAARTELAAALELAEKSPEGERWLWEAHHFMARASGQRPEAAKHWEQFLRLGPLDSPYRAEAKAMLQKLGKPWSGE